MAPVKPAVQPSAENYPAQEHEHMQNLTTQNYDPNAATEVIDAWTKFGTKFRELANDFHKIVNDSQGGWNGAAAEGVRQALTKVSKFADETGTAFHSTAGAIAVQRDAAVQANRSMPTPVEFSPLKIAGKWGAAAVIAPPAMIGGAVEMISTHNEKQEAKQEAVRVMQQRDTTMMSAAQSMPAMDATPEVTKDQGVTQTSSTTHSQSLSNASTFRPPANTGMPPGSSNNGTTNPAWVAPPSTPPNVPPGNNQSLPPGGQNRPLIAPLSGFPPGSRPPGGGQAGRPPGGGAGRPPGGGPGMRPGGSGGTGGGGAGRGMGPGGMAGAAGRGMGSFGPATPGGGAGVMGPGGGPGGAGAGAARGGAAGAGGMGAGGGAGKGEEDKEHKSNYLIPTDEFFDDDRMVAPPVIGG
ncbi:hypothetical protein SK803_12070 [Lentzea sp. BCCO 10_0856]|uniref:PPE family protein n=1 Tax=Lentzea miocenica TaxID=3095431 RepID=A0ABU4SYI0_9PSEU|nr:hypothetical protein [Lentzea sp. BCCO 10_0856]MDX8030956.1 hypothetical protein [Lentzea sp. BCCO 10_0856]